MPSSDRVMWKLIKPEDVCVHYDLYKKMLLKAERHLDDRYTADDIIELVERGEMYLWAVWADGSLRAIVITILTDYPRNRVAEIFLVVGKHYESFKALYDIIYEWAKAHGCDSLEAECRKGWLLTDTQGLKDSGKVMMRQDIN